MSNRDLVTAWHYHELTKHTLRSVRSGGHYLDWANQSLPFKVYSDLDPIPLPLPRDWAPSHAIALSTIGSSRLLKNPASR